MIPTAVCTTSGINHAVHGLITNRKISEMHPFDIAAIAIYLVIVLGLGFWFGGKQSRDEFFRAGGSMGWFAVGLSVMATLFSSNSFVFYTSAAFGNSLRIGISLLAFTLMTPIVMWVFIPVYARLQLQTAYEYLELRFHVAVRILASTLFVLLRIGWMASATYAASVVVSSVIDVSQTTIIIVIGGVSVGYTMLGGLRAVMWTDVVQFFVFTITILITLGIVVAQTGLGVSEISETYFAGRSGLVVNFAPSMTLEYGSWAILIGVFLEALSGFGVDQVAVQRYLSARSERESQWGALLNLAGMWLVLPSLLLIGVVLYAYFLERPEELGTGTLAEILQAHPKIADQAMPTFARLHFPPGMAGLFLAALIAAIMSSIDSGIHSVTTALVVDFRDRLFPHWRPRDEAVEVRTIRIMVVLVGALAITLACFVGSLGNVFDVGKKLTSAFGGPLLAIFILALFSRRAHWLAVLLSVSLSTVVTLGLMYTQNWFSVWYWPIGFGLSLVSGYLFSLMFKPLPTEYTYFQLMRRPIPVPQAHSAP